MATALAVARQVGGLAWDFSRWTAKHWVGPPVVLTVSVALWVLADRRILAVTVALLGWIVPALIWTAWARFWPHSWHRRVVAPAQRRRWRKHAHASWPFVARECGLSTQRQVKVHNWWNGQDTTEARWTPPRLKGVRAEGYMLLLTIRARTGQTARDIANQAQAIGAAANAHSVTARVLSPSVASVSLVMVDQLAGVRHSPNPVPDDTSPVVIGRSETSVPVVWDPTWCLHTAIQGATRSGKSALCYGYLAALAMRRDVVVCGIDPTGILLTPFAHGRGGSWVVPTAKDGPRAVAVLDAITDHMDARIQAVLAQGRDKIETFHESTPVVLVVMEEYPGLLSQLRKDDAREGRAVKDRCAPKVEAAVGRIIKEGAKAGVIALILGQRMSANAIDTDDRSNIPTRLTLRVDNGDAVRMLHDGIDTGGTEEVRQFPPGRALYEAPGVPLQRVQAHFTTYDMYLARVANGVATTYTITAFAPPVVVVPLPEPGSKGKAA